MHHKSLTLSLSGGGLRQYVLLHGALALKKKDSGNRP
jgi:hypothetical protein